MKKQDVVFTGSHGELSRAISIRMLKLQQVIDKTGLSRSTIYSLLDSKSVSYDPSFPTQVNIGTKSVAWVEAEIDEWLYACIESSRHVGGRHHGVC